MESRPFLERRPGQALIAGEPTTGARHVRLTYGKRYAFVYIPEGDSVEIRLGVIAGRTVRAEWFDPRTGATGHIGSFPNMGTRVFDPPGPPDRGNDWVLVLDGE
jgi:hypothetical protein